MRSTHYFLSDVLKGLTTQTICRLIVEYMMGAFVAPSDPGDSLRLWWTCSKEYLQIVLKCGFHLIQPAALLSAWGPLLALAKMKNMALPRVGRAPRHIEGLL